MSDIENQPNNPALSIESDKICIKGWEKVIQKSLKFSCQFGPTLPQGDQKEMQRANLGEKER